MMHKTPSERIKIASIKSHPWFLSLKIPFDDRESVLSQSNLITDSMLLEGDDPFDDFMNKRLLGSNGSGHSSDDRSRSDSRISDFEEGLKQSNSAQSKMSHASNISFKKNRITGELEKLGNLETIPEERIPESGGSDHMSPYKKINKFLSNPCVNGNDDDCSQEDEVLKMISETQTNNSLNQKEVIQLK
jgi:serine/threonine protein kinase